MKDYAVIIGRFQPLHKQHEALIARALTLAPRLIMILGSAENRRTKKNPFLYQERARMIKCAFPEAPITFLPVSDRPGRDGEWADYIRRLVMTYSEGNPTILVGNCKPGEMYLRDLFPNLEKDLTYWEDQDINSTRVRKLFFTSVPGESVGPELQCYCSTPVIAYLQEFLDSSLYDEAHNAYWGY